MADEVKTEQTEETKETAQPVTTQPTADKVDIEAIARAAAEKAIEVADKRKEGTYKSMLEQQGIDAQTAAAEAKKWMEETRKKESDIETLLAERETLTKEAARAKVLDQKFVAIEKGVPAKLADKYVKLAEAYPEYKEDIGAALDQAIAEFPYKSETPTFTAPTTPGQASEFGPEFQSRIDKWSKRR